MKDLIHKYIDGEMTVAEQVAFEELLRNDAELRKEFMLRKDVDNAINEDDVMNLRESMEEIMHPNFSKRIQRPAFYTITAAAMAILIVLGVFFLPLNQKTDAKQLFTEYYVTYPSLVNTRTATDISIREMITREAFDYYEQQEFSKAKKQFKELVNTDKDNHMALFYLAISCVELEDFSQAEKYLNQLIKNPNHIFWEQAYWYLSLVYLQQEEYEKAKLLLQTIIKERYSYASRAEKILTQLD